MRLCSVERWQQAWTRTVHQIRSPFQGIPVLSKNRCAKLSIRSASASATQERTEIGEVWRCSQPVYVPYVSVDCFGITCGRLNCGPPSVMTDISVRACPTQLTAADDSTCCCAVGCIHGLHRQGTCLGRPPLAQGSDEAPVFST